ncbi:MAG: Xylose isomerase domain protein barrel, partial [Acidimicrobiaceae bacterium]|nr:Xylose isomerase domain protein barrel [Acidimicrobiaceae bacterium]
DDTQVRLSAVVEAPVAEAERVGRQVEAAGLAVADVFLIPGSNLEALAPNHPDPAVREASLELYRKTLEFAHALGAPGVTVLPGVRFGGESVEQAIGRAAADLSHRAELAGHLGLTLSVEGHSGSCVESPEAFAELLERTPGLWATLDPSHYAFAGFAAPDLVPLIARTRHVQVRPCGPQLMQGRLPDNTFDLEFFVKSLKAGAYSGWVATEFVWMEKWSCDRVDNTSETARLKHYLTELGQRTGF